MKLDGSSSKGKNGKSKQFRTYNIYLLAWGEMDPKI